MSTIILTIIMIIVVLYLLYTMMVALIGDAQINFKTKEHSPFILDEITDNSISMSTLINVTNEGKQCGTIMDCYVRQLLPYEQFDGVKVEAKAELKGAPREDDYFEATLIQKKGTAEDNIDIIIRVTLTNRKGKNIRETLKNIVDIPLDIVYQHAARYPWKISKETIVLPAEEIARLANIQLED